MVAALLPVESLKLGHENRHEHVLVLEMVLAKPKLHVLKVGKENEEELKGGVHRELPEKNGRRAECETEADLLYLELLDVDLLHVSLGLHIRLALLFQFVKGALYLSNFITHRREYIWLLDSSGVRSTHLIGKESLLGLTRSKLRLLSEFGGQLKDVKHVFVGLIAEIPIQVQLKGYDLQNEVLVVQ